MKPYSIAFLVLSFLYGIIAIAGVLTPHMRPATVIGFAGVAWCYGGFRLVTKS